MTVEQYEKLKKDLQSIVKDVPLRWGSVQNNTTDAGIKMFEINDYAVLQNAIKTLPIEQQQYLIRRWFLWQCSKCDEYLFALNRNVLPNPDAKSKDYDIQFNNDEALQFDLKGTVIPKQFRNNIETIFANPQLLIDFYYAQQSKEVRFGEQNRLFIVHHSFRNVDRELIIRAHFDFKKEAFKRYAMQTLLGKKYLTYKNAKADVIFILEKEDKLFEYKFI
jgi:hypothetical protein